MPDSSALDQAVIDVLRLDGPLTALMPDGVYYDEAAPGKTRFVIVSIVDEHDEPKFEGRAFEDTLYMVKAVALSTTGGDVKSAAARIDTLLDNGTISPAGYAPVTMRRDSRIRLTEVDQDDPSIRWQHRGGRYQAMAAPNA